MSSKRRIPLWAGAVAAAGLIGFASAFLVGRSTAPGASKTVTSTTPAAPAAAVAMVHGAAPKIARFTVAAALPRLVVPQAPVSTPYTGGSTSSGGSGGTGSGGGGYSGGGGGGSGGGGGGSGGGGGGSGGGGGGGGGG